MTDSVLFLIDDLAEGLPAAPQPFHQADLAAPQLSVLDLSATRGDGIFETAGVNHGRPQAIGPHLRRFQRSAELLDLPAPRLEVWEAAVRAAIEAWGSDQHGFAKFVYTRGIEGAGRPTGWVVVGPADASDATVRAEGIAVVTLDRGYRSDIAKTSPWLLQGAKTLSYAVNQAALREAAKRGADDALFISTDGYVLEGPHATLLLRFGDEYVTPATDQGILTGTTQGDVFEHLVAEGITATERQVPMRCGSSRACATPPRSASWTAGRSRSTARRPTGSTPSSSIVAADPPPASRVCPAGGDYSAGSGASAASACRACASRTSART